MSLFSWLYNSFRPGYWFFGKIYEGDEIDLGDAGYAVVLEVREVYDTKDLVTKLVVKVRGPEGIKRNFKRAETRLGGLIWDWYGMREEIKNYYKK